MFLPDVGVPWADAAAGERREDDSDVADDRIGTLVESEASGDCCEGLEDVKMSASLRDLATVLESEACGDCCD